MNQQALTNNPLDYPPFNNMPLLHEKQQHTTQQTLLYIKSIIPQKYFCGCKSHNLTSETLISQVKLGVEAMIKDIPTEQPTEESQTNSVKGNQEIISKLMEALEESQNRSKKLQIKLLTKIKRLDQQLKEKDIELTQVKDIFQQKQIQLETLNNMNQKKYRHIRALQEDIYDLEQQFDRLQQMLEDEIKKNEILTKRINQFESKFKSRMDVEIQTERKNDQLFQCNWIAEEKKKNYKETMEQLTFQLTQACQKINQLKKLEDNQNQSQVTATNCSNDSQAQYS